MTSHEEMMGNEEAMRVGMVALKRTFIEDIAVIRETPVLWPLALLVIASASVSFISLRALGVVVPVCFLLALLALVVQTGRFPRPSAGILIVWLVFVALIGLATTRSLDFDYASGRFLKLGGMSLLAVLFWALSARVTAL